MPDSVRHIAFVWRARRRTLFFPGLERKLCQFLQLISQDLLIRQPERIVGNKCRGHAAAQGIFHDRIILARAEDQAHARILIWFLHIPIQCFKIEIDLTDMLRLEPADLQLDRHKAGQRTVIEKQIDIEILPADLNSVFFTDKGKILAELKDKLL